MTSLTFSFRNVLIVSIILRVALIQYSEWHDAHSVVKYTDVDYRVFTDAARFLWAPAPSNVEEQGTNIAEGLLGEWSGFGNPYKRATYRYTPLLAALLTPNIWLHPSFGKYIFATCDIIVGVLIYRLMQSRNFKFNGSTNSSSSKEPKDAKHPNVQNHATLYAALHLLNPLVFSISTRGSSESVLAILVMSTLYFALHERWDATAILLGISTHWKIYPVIYAASLLGVITSSKNPQNNRRTFWSSVISMVNIKTIRFAFLSGGTFMALGLGMYLIWGYPFLYETYLYHLIRRDYKHNFSPYWFPIYLTLPSPDSTQMAANTLSILTRFVRSPLASFLPQMSLAIGTGFAFGRSKEHLPFAWFVQTAAFVTFNKVCTSQYFLWYLTLLPLVLPNLCMSRTRAITITSAWVLGQAVWLQTAYKLEFLGQNVFYALWLRSLAFLIVNVGVLGEIIKAYRPGNMVKML